LPIKRGATLLRGWLPAFFSLWASHGATAASALENWWQTGFDNGTCGWGADQICWQADSASATAAVSTPTFGDGGVTGYTAAV